MDGTILTFAVRQQNLCDKMPTPSEQAEQVRQLLSEGETGQAVSLLTRLCKNHRPICDDAILLENSFRNLEEEIAHGTISHENESIEERRITLAALRLANLLEKAQSGEKLPTPPVAAPSPGPHSPSPSLRRLRPAFWAAGLVVLAVVVAWVIGGRPSSPGVAAAAPFDLVIQVKKQDERSSLHIQGTVRAVLAGTDTLPPQPLDGQGQVVYRQLPSKRLHSPVTLAMDEMNYQFSVVEPASPLTAGAAPLVFQLKPVMETYTGKVLDQRGKAVGGAVLNFGFGDGVAATTTDASGSFRVELPRQVKEPAHVQVKITHRGKVVKDENLWQSAGVLGELKVRL